MFLLTRTYTWTQPSTTTYNTANNITNNMVATSLHTCKYLCAQIAWYSHPRFRNSIARRNGGGGSTHWWYIGSPKRLSARRNVSNVLCAAMPHLRMHINRACDHRVVLHATARTTYPSAGHSSCRHALRAVHGLLLVDPSKQCGYRRAGWPNRPSGRWPPAASWRNVNVAIAWSTIDSYECRDCLQNMFDYRSRRTRTQWPV